MIEVRIWATLVLYTMFGRLLLPCPERSTARIEACKRRKLVPRMRLLDQPTHH
jgi:hypothetical protein